MENASKALIMAAEILIGIMIISIGVYLFGTMGEYSADTTAELEERQISQFNNQFLKYYGTQTLDNGETEPIKCTIHDIIGLANLARKTNEDNGFTEIPTRLEQQRDSLYYIQIDLEIKRQRPFTNLETYSQDALVNLLKQYSIIYSQDEDGNTIAQTKYFMCESMPGIGENTRLVNYMKFVEI